MEIITKLDSTLMLNPEAPLFKVLRDNPPTWWTKLVNDPEIYIEIRKGNKIHAYFYGARVAEIMIENNTLTAKCHVKYIYGKETIKTGYASCVDLLDKGLPQLKRNAESCYLKETEGEDTAEKRIQGRLRIDNCHRYIDSEFELSYSEDGEKTNQIRFDLVAIEDNEIKIEELKRIGDDRLRTKDMDVNPPEVLGQLQRYANFMKENNTALCQYYEALLSIKSMLGLPLPLGYHKDKVLKLDPTPLLIIKNLYQYSKMNTARFDRIKDIRAILEKNEIKYYILP